MDRMSPVRQDVTVVGRRLEPEDHRLRDFLTRTDQAYEWVEAGTPEAADLLARHGAAEDDLPLVLAPDGVVTSATVERVADAWHASDPPQRTHYDLAIVGAGPAGLAAAVYAASDGLSTLLVERDVPGGQASHTSKIENFFGFPGGIEGARLARLAGRQAEGFGAELVLLRGVTGSGTTPEGTQLDIAGGYQVTADVVIAAPGMDWRTLDVDGIEAGLGRGIYYGAGRSEAARCGGDPVVVVGAGNSAGQAVMNLADAGARVTMLVRGTSLGEVDVGVSGGAHPRAPADRGAAADRGRGGVVRRRPPQRDRGWGGAPGSRSVPLPRRRATHGVGRRGGRGARCARVHPHGPGPAG